MSGQRSNAQQPGLSVAPFPGLDGKHRPAFAIVCNTYAPYRIHLHTRLAREIPELTFYSISTHGHPAVPWSLHMPPDLRHVGFGDQEDVGRQSKLGWAWHEWKKGGSICHWLANHHVKLVMVNGYMDLGRVRIIRWCRRHHVPVFVQGDSNIANDTAAGIKRRLKLWVVTRILSCCNGALACGSRGRAYFRRYGVPDKHIHILALEPDYAEVMNVTAAEKAAAQKCFGLAPDRRRLIFSGRLVGLKRIDTLIAAFSEIAAARPNWDLVIAGDGELRATLTAQVPASLNSRVVWTGFIATQQQLCALYHACDVLVLPSEREAWAVVINEATAAGLAIISSSVPGAVAELVRDGVNGRIFPPGDVAALTAALLDVTDAGRIDAMKAESPKVLAAWRAVADPVDAARRLLTEYGLLPASSAAPHEDSLASVAVVSS